MRNKRRVILLVSLSALTGALITLILISHFNWTLWGLASDKVGEAKRPKTFLPKDPSPQGGISSLYDLSEAFAEVAEKVTPSVVTVYSEKVIRLRRWRSPFEEFFFGDEFFRQFFGVPRRRRQPEEEKFIQRGLGSGVIVREDGYILTNYHVIKGADDIRVKTHKREVYEAKVIGTDPQTDLAVLKITARGLPAATLGNSDNIRVGEWVLAIGNPFSDALESTVTAGIISAKGRSLQLAAYEDFIQTDAAINPGNSGGPLVNLRGEVIGINTAIVSQVQQYAGIGFAIPINIAKRVMEDLVTKGKVERGYLGVYIQDVDDDLAKAIGLEEIYGAVITDVTKGSPADKAGLREGDVIVEFNGQKVRDVDHLRVLVSSARPNSKATLKINRDGRFKEITVTLGELPSEAKEIRPSEKAREKLGLEVQDLTRELARRYGYEGEKGVIITKVDPDSPAGRKGLEPGDLIKEINREPIKDIRDYNRIVGQAKPGDVLLFRVLVHRQKVHRFFALEVPED